MKRSKISKRAKQIAAPIQRNDDWQSLLGAFGDRRDRGLSSATQFVASSNLSESELYDAYEKLWLVRRLIEDSTNEALRNGWGTPDDFDLRDFDRLNYSVHTEGAFQRACNMAALTGGAILYLGYANGGKSDEPAPPNGEVAFLEVFDRFQLTGHQRLNDVDSPQHGRPEVWQVTGNTNRTGLRFHTSRAILFPGAARARGVQIGSRDSDWDLSQLEAVWTDVQRYGVFWQSVGHLMQLASVGVLTLKGLIEMLASEQVASVEARIDLLNEALSNTRLLMLDADGGEEYRREAVSFTDMPALLQELQLATAGAFGRPVTKLFGRAPAGMNATGEAETRDWYDRVESYRARVIQPRLADLLERISGSEVEVDFESLWQPTEKEKVEVEKLRVERDSGLFQVGAFTADEIRKAYQEGKPVEEVATGPLPEPEPALTPTDFADPNAEDNDADDPADPAEDPNA